MITREPIDTRAFVGEIDPACGAVATFHGVIRNHSDGRPVERLWYDCYDEMAAGEMAAIADEFSDAAAGIRVKAVHRVGELAVGDTALVVVAQAPHRREAFDVCARVVDAIKARVPIWKKEAYEDDTSRWL